MSSYRKGIQDGLPIAIGYLSVSFTFGMKAVGEGLLWWQALLISMTNLTSAGQFAGLSVMTAGGTFIEMACTQLVINMRYALMSLSLSQKVDGSISGVRRWIVGFGVTDEIFAVAMGNYKAVGMKYMLGLMSTPYLGWSLGTLIGAVAGSVLPGVVRSALGVAIFAMFIAIFVPPMKKNKAVAIVVAIAVGLSCCFKWVPVINRLSGGFAVIICSVFAAAVGAVLFPINSDGEPSETT